MGANPEIGLGKLISRLERLKRARPSNVCRKRIVIGDEAHLPGDVEHLSLPAATCGDERNVRPSFPFATAYIVHLWNNTISNLEQITTCGA